MNILCLGCSFTDDMVINGDINRNSWPKELSKLMPDHLIINAAMAWHVRTCLTRKLVKLARYQMSNCP